MKTPAATVAPKKFAAADWVFIGLGLLVAVLAGLAAASHPQALVASKTFWALLLVAITLLAVPWLLRPRFKQNLLLLVISLLVIELFLEGLGWAGLLPGVNTMSPVAYARIYWTYEGHGNSIRNRYGWHDPEFNLAATNRIALIGDSFVEAVQVNRHDNMGVKLGGKLAGPWQGYSVLSLGTSDTGPAQYYEVLQYAERHFHIREAVIVIYLGNDITDCSAPMALKSDSFIYYGLDESGGLTLSPLGHQLVSRYSAELDARHQPPWLEAPAIFASHNMCLHIPWSIRNNIVVGRLAKADPLHCADTDAELSKLGLRAGAFAMNPDHDSREAMLIVQGLLQHSADFCAGHSIQFHVLTIPSFPPDFYATQKGTDWSMRFGDYDFLKPEREITGWANQHHVSVLPLGDWMHHQKLDVNQVRSLFFAKGSGHLTEAGHRFVAEAMAENFYPGVK